MSRISPFLELIVHHGRLLWSWIDYRRARNQGRFSSCPWFRFRGEGLSLPCRTVILPLEDRTVLFYTRFVI